MESFKYSEAIRAPREVVWKTLTYDDEFQRWAASFAEGSYRVGGWAVGDTVRFLTPEGNGMICLIEEHCRPAVLSMKSVGVVIGGRDDTESEEAYQWVGSLETYTLKEVDGGTELTVEVDVPEVHRVYFVEAWQRALGCIKSLAESAPW